MANYKAYVVVRMYREFDFEADDDDLAWDHIEKLTYDGGPSYVMSQWEESGPDDIYIESVDWIDG